MINPPLQFFPLPDLVGDSNDGFNQIGSIGGAACLVVDNGKLFSLLPQAQHRFDEIMPVNPVNPGCAQDDMLCQ